MKQPKEPKKWRRPRVYLQLTDDRENERLRIIYPDGSSEWSYYHVYFNIQKSHRPCWSAGCEWIINSQRSWNTYVLGIDTSPQEALRRMRKYDKEMRFPKALYLGET